MKYTTIPTEWIKGLIQARNSVVGELYDTNPFKDAFQRLIGYLDTCETLIENHD